MINKNLTIVGTGADVLTVSGSNSSRVFHSSSGKTVAISGMTFVNGSFTGLGGAIYNDHATLQLTSCAIASTSSSNRGAGITNDGSAGGGATLTINRCTFSSNTTTDSGGAIYNDGAAGAAVLSITNSTFSANSANGGGGALFNDGEGGGNASATVTNCTFFGNAASGGFGGGLDFNG